MTYVNATTVSCTFCGAAIAEPCAKVGAHPSRIEAAARAMGLNQAETNEVVRGELMTRIKRYRALHGPSSLWDAQSVKSAETPPEEVAHTAGEA